MERFRWKKLSGIGNVTVMRMSSLPEKQWREYLCYESLPYRFPTYLPYWQEVFNKACVFHKISPQFSLLSHGNTEYALLP